MYETLKFTEMTTRRVIDAKDKDGEKVYVKGHAKATYMSDGRTVEDAIKQIGTGGGGGGGIAVETDPIFSASPAATITEEKMAEWDRGSTAVQPETLAEYASEAYVDAEVKALGDSLAEVASSGSYNDLQDKPNIPSAITESTVSGWGFTKNTGTYSKPSGGIPKSDLASDVQASLSNADNAVQKDMVGTLNIIEVEGVYDGDYVYALPTAAAKNVNEDYDDIILSRGSVKTLNGESIFGSGDITINGGSGEQGPQGDKGDKGDKGDTGTGVQSVKQTTISNTDGGSNVVTVTLTNGATSTFTVKNGSKGSTGANGTNGKDGADGATFTPSVDSNGNLSWTNNKGLTNPPTVNIKGPKGDAGEGGGSSGGGVPVIAVTIHMGELSFSEHTIPLEPDKIYYANESIEMVYIYTVTPPTGDVGKYSVHFTTTSIVLGFECPQNWLWANGTTPTLEPSTTYELSVVATKFGDDYIYKAGITPFKAL